MNLQLALRHRAAIGLLLFLSSCTSLWQQRDEQAVVWEDGDPAKIEVWLSQGSSMLGQPWFFLIDVVATPVLVVNETFFACGALGREDARIAAGPFGYLASLLPGITCMPLDAHPSVWLRLSEPLRLPAAERERLSKLGPCGGVRWLAEHYARQVPRGAVAAEFVRDWVVSVRLVRACEATSSTTGGSSAR
ncbi:MAG: hypothetical protein IPN34_22390 [Planctomycetes bacterium]|nr:hypothetical protein [Planctomycetota bacterium]